MKPQRPLRLAECGDTVGVREYCAALGISERQFYRWKQHGVLPVKPLKLRGSVIRFSTEAVRAFVGAR